MVKTEHHFLACLEIEIDNKNFFDGAPGIFSSLSGLIQ